MSLINFSKVLTWGDFPNPYPAGKADEAVISVTWKLDADQFERHGNAIVLGRYSVEIMLVSNSCAVVKAVANGDRALSDALLKHEQGHYDIMALGAREFHNRLIGLSATTEEELNKKWQNLNNEIIKKADLVDERYDIATNHSKNATVQKTWDQKIDAVKKNPKGLVTDLL